jgi:outer membrane protein assembly factor BamB
MKSKVLSLFAILALTSTAHADWTRFRGPNGSGIAPDSQPVPTTWSDTENLKWKFALPGPGSSSPIVVGNKVFITCWSGYGTDPQNPGSMEDLKRHLICVDRATGKELWNRAIKAKLPEDRYGGMFAQHGYASHTPVSDGRNVYVHFGKSGVFAFDLEGKQLWQGDVGDGLNARAWGSSSSPILHKNLLIVTASAESQAMVAFDKTNGSEVWRQVAGGFDSTWGSPVVASVDGRDDIVLSVPGEIWGINPETGKLRWFSAGLRGDSICGSAIVQDGVVYAMADRGGGSVAVKAGGKGDVSQSHVVWTGGNGSRIPTPVLWQGRLYWVSGSLVNCRDAKTGQEIYSERLPGDAPQAGGQGGQGGPGGFGGRGGGGGFGGGDYASPVAANGHLYQITRRGETLVVKLGDKFELVARNRFASDTSDFSATPAISGGQLFLRSARNLYCVGK